MKARYGNWDCSPAIPGQRFSQTAASLEEAVRKHAAFPIVVSAEDAYPGHGKVDAVQGSKAPSGACWRASPRP